jgi:hypothetical protein
MYEYCSPTPNLRSVNLSLSLSMSLSYARGNNGEWRIRSDDIPLQISFPLFSDVRRLCFLFSVFSSPLVSLTKVVHLEETKAVVFGTAGPYRRVAVIPVLAKTSEVYFGLYLNYEVSKYPLVSS